MLSIQKLFRRDPQFFELFEVSARLSCTCAGALSKILQNPTSPDALKELQEARLQTEQNTAEISRLAAQTFITVIDREDIESLASALHRVQKPIEKFAERFLISQRFLAPDQFRMQDELIHAATDIVSNMVRQLKEGLDLERMLTLNAKLLRIEDDADKLEVQLIMKLYESTTDALQVFVTKDLYDILEKVIDRCRDVGNNIVQICHKNS